MQAGVRVALGLVGAVVLVAAGRASGFGTFGKKPSGAPSGEPRKACLTVQEADQVWVPGGTFQFGTDHAYPEEAPAHPVTSPASVSIVMRSRTPSLRALWLRRVWLHHAQ